MNRFRFDLGPPVLKLAGELGVKWNSELKYELAWKQWTGDLIAGLEKWCKDAGVRDYGCGYSNYYIMFSISNPQQAMLFKLRWANHIDRTQGNI